MIRRFFKDGTTVQDAGTHPHVRTYAVPQEIAGTVKTTGTTTTTGNVGAPLAVVQNVPQDRKVPQVPQQTTGETLITIRTTAATLLAILMLFCTTAGFAQSGTTGPLTWKLDKKSGTLTIGGNGAMPDYEPYGDENREPWLPYMGAITSVVTGNGVTTIGNSAFTDYTNLVSVKMPNVRTIGWYAFYKCTALVSVEMPKVTTVGSNAFSRCHALASVVMPSVTTIGYYAFEYCYALASVVMPNAATVGEWAFVGCDALVSIDMPNATTIGSNAFFGCSFLASVTMPNVTTVGDGAFSDCRHALVSVAMPKVTTVGVGAFADCDALVSIDMPKVTAIGEAAFAYCDALVSVNLPDGVTEIGDGAFRGCSSLTAINVAAGNANYASEDGILFDKSKTVLIRYPKGKKETDYTIPTSVTTIGEEAFYNCDALTSVSMPNVETIGNNAFRGCIALVSVDIPDGVTEIGAAPFTDCTGLTAINVAAGNENYASENGVLFNKSKTVLIQYPKGKKETDYTIPTSVTTIGEEAFYNCDALASVSMSNVETIGAHAFYGCRNITSVTLPSSVTKIGMDAFNGSGLNDMYLHCTIPPVAYYTISRIIVGGFQKMYILHVPAGSEKSYRAAEGWKDFYKIVGDAVP